VEGEEKVQKLTFGDNVTNEWNMVGGYYDILYKLWTNWYNAFSTPGIGDDLDAIKLIIIHVSPKSYYMQIQNKKRVDKYVKRWQEDIREIEDELTRISKVKKNTDYLVKSMCKKKLGEVAMSILFQCQVMGMFDKSHTFKTPKDALRDIMDEDEIDKLGL